jgi:hypothetical protein
MPAMNMCVSWPERDAARKKAGNGAGRPVAGGHGEALAARIARVSSDRAKRMLKEELAVSRSVHDTT